MRRLKIIDSPEYMGYGAGVMYREHDKYSHDPELQDAYECGIKEGWRRAMHEAERERYHERHYPEHGGHILYREHPAIREAEPDEIVYRRRRDVMGRYI